MLGFDDNGAICEQCNAGAEGTQLTPDDIARALELLDQREGITEDQRNQVRQTFLRTVTQQK